MTIARRAISLSILLLFLAPYLCGTAQAAGQPPNIVLILTDDEGWNGTSVQMDPDVPGSKSDFYQTPRLEELAAAGMRFSDGYSSTTVCATTRAAIQTGISAAQLQNHEFPQDLPPGAPRWQTLYTGLPLTPPAPEPFNVDNVTIARMLKQADPNYVAGYVGKWHLDTPATTTPELMGYDYAQDLFPIPDDNVDPWGMFKAADLTNAFMEDRVANNEPFFVQLAERAVHNPIRSRDVIREKYEALTPGTIHHDPAYAAMTEDLDTSIGMVLDKITELGIEDNTYVVYVSDNGANPGYSNNYPLKLGKGTDYEGGIRVPFIVRGPNIAPNSVSDIPVTTTDLFTTFAAMAGFQGPLPAGVEGANLLPVLENSGQLPAGVDHLTRQFHEGGEIYFHQPVRLSVGNLNTRPGPQSVVRDGDYKLIVEQSENGGPDEIYLFDLANDLSESHNLAASMPEKTAELKAKLDRYLDSIDASFSYDIKQDFTLQWDASRPGNDPARWRSSIDVRDKQRETWYRGTGSQEPQLQTRAPYQPGLPKQAFHFDGNDVMTKLFFQVGDDGPRNPIADVGTPDWNRSASMEFWVRTDSLSQEQVLFESGDGTGGISVTLGDADSDGLTNDVRFRILGYVGPNGGDSNAPPQALTVTAKIDRFANPLRDFLHITTVFNDDPNDRYGEIYVNGALAARVNGTLGIEQSLQWDGYDGAGLGNIGDHGLGANGGTGDLPFSGPFRGDMALMRFYNHAISASAIRDNYNEVHRPANYGIHSVAGDVIAPSVRPTAVSLDATESSSLLVVQERSDHLDADLLLDASVTGPVLLDAGNSGDAGLLAAGTEFTSYLLQFDPASNDGGIMESVSGSIVFQQEILGIILDPQSLVDADYATSALGDYGMETDRGLLLTGDDFLSISGDRRLLSFDLSIPGDEMLQFRVLTEQVLSADFNNDGFVDGTDLAVWETSYGADTAADVNFDGQTDGKDFLLWQRRRTGMSPLSADFDHSGFVDGADLAMWESAFGVNAGGDANGDGRTDGKDFLLWQRQAALGSPLSSSQSVPEPAAWVLALGASLLVSCKRDTLRRRPRRTCGCPSEWSAAGLSGSTTRLGLG